MEDDEGERAPLQKPKSFPAADAGRRAVKVVASIVPYAGAALAELADAALPNPEHKDRKRWEGEVTDGVNTLHGKVGEISEQLAPATVTIGGPAAAIAKHMVQNCPDGLMQEWMSIDDLQPACPEFGKRELLNGLGDLESYGLIESISFIGKAPDYRLTQDAYEQLDLPIMNWDTMKDARELARLSLKSLDGVSVVELEKATGWPRRRLNPALRIVVGFVGHGRVSQTMQPDYVTRHFSPNNAERARLRQFAAPPG
jgi:hypothetical protein